MTNAFFRLSRSRVTRASATSRSGTRASSDAATGPDCSRCELFPRDHRLGFDNPYRSATDGAECPYHNLATTSRWNSAVNDRRDCFVF